jgi:hypothetical protein
VHVDALAGEVARKDPGEDLLHRLALAWREA